MNSNRLRWGLKIGVMIVLVVIALGLAVMSLWNWLAPELFGWRTIGFAQAVGLLVLSRLLVGGLRGGRGGHLHWRARLAERMEQMTPEQREKFRAGLHGRCRGQTSSEPEAKGQSG